MSNGLAIAAVTATLRSVLDKGLNPPPPPILPTVGVTARPIDKARESGDQVNLFLYHVELDGAWRNTDMPGQVKPGETGRPPLPLVLFYLLTAYGSDDTHDVQAHALLGRAMGILHDHPLLGAAEIANAFPGSDLDLQIERVRITPQPLPVDEISKLWTAFQTQFRAAAAYQVSVVLIESRRAAKAPLPVLQRGPGDTGVVSQPDLIPPFPTLTELVLPGRQAALLGDTVTLRGHHLDQGTLSVRFANPRLTDPVPVQILAQTSNEVRLRLLDTPDDPAAAKKWVAGFYTVALVLTDGDRERTTNELPLAVAPRILSSPATVARGPLPDLEALLALPCSPEARLAQRAALLLGDREVPPEPRAAASAPLTFKVKQAPLGKHFLRLRVDGVDSFLIDPTAVPPAFDTSLQVEIQ